MPNFFAPNGSRDGYEQIGTITPDSVSLVRLYEGAILQIGLLGADGFDISSSVSSIASDIPRAETKGANNSRMLMLQANKAGTCQLIAKDKGTQSVALDIVVIAAPASKHWSKLTLMPVGLKSLSACRKWISDVDDEIKKVFENPVGKIVLNYAGDVTIMPDHVDKDCNASSLTVMKSGGDSFKHGTVQFSPSLCKGQTGAGDQPDEVLCHELIHQVDDDGRAYSNMPDPAHPPQPAFEFHKTDFMTITITNLYASVNTRPLRKDHMNSATLPSTYSSNEAKFFNDFRGNFVSLNRRKSRFYWDLIFVDVPWDPFQEIKP